MAHRRERAQRRRTDLRWYAKPDQPHDAIMGVVDKLMKDTRRQQLMRWRDLFLDEPVFDEREDFDDERPGIRARFNVIRNAVETLLARVGKSQPDPMIVTVGGDWKLQRKARAMEQFLLGDFSRLDRDLIRARTLFDALIFGTGIIKVYPQHGRNVWERVWRGNLLTDKREEAADRIRTQYQIAAYDREVLAEMCETGKQRAYVLDRLAPLESDLLPSEDGTDDLVLVVEAWRLGPSPKVAGRRALIVDGMTLDDDDWNRDGFPFAKIHAFWDPLRHWGIGLPQRMAGGQYEQNSLSEVISDGARYWTPKICLPHGSKMKQADEETNTPFEIWECSADAPVILQGDPASAGLMIYADNQRRSMLAEQGISETSSQSEIPDNVKSAKHEMVHNDIESERHVMLGLMNEGLTVQLGELSICSYEDIFDAGDGDELLAYVGKHVLKELRYADVRLGDHHYEVRTYAISKMANTPSGKLKQVREMLDLGFIGLAQARRLYDMPDLDQESKLALSGGDLALDLIEAALDQDQGAKLQRAPSRACDRNFLIE